MNYITAGLYGDYEAYKRMKKLLKGEDDVLWILGDVLDGNTEHPEDCLKILDDIKEDRRVLLILGDHEYFHTMRLFGILEKEETPEEGYEEGEEEDDSEVWTSEIEQFEFPGTALMRYMDTVLSYEEKMDYARFMASLDVSEITFIGGRLFYLCHGAPSPLGESESQWQYNVVTNKIDFSKSYRREMSNDIRMGSFTKELGIRRADVEGAVLVTGHDFTATLEMNGEEVEDGIVCVGKILSINAGASADNGEPHIVVGIDSAGWQTFEV